MNRFISIAILLLFLAGMVLFVDPPYYRLGEHTGVILNTYVPGRMRLGSLGILVRLDDGRVVNASIPSLANTPYPNGTDIFVVEYRSFLFHKHSFAARHSK